MINSIKRALFGGPVEVIVRCAPAPSPTTTRLDLLQDERLALLAVLKSDRLEGNPADAEATRALEDVQVAIATERA